ncbi:PREDICTED: uncharacterized protein LOC104826814 [Tarenaya hassleriana]|uniref:uncharacterized protein LOC104826814 n=1 Tax=Tarenaya hassleriana TaxID=28532 RepID=UPI00053CA9D6|nr:PREDICTED: uncharacterized protein LOC104826814 [Tarenaya hassleriana]XP_010558009.1 PREDICTED: uncharacterized protein LOC104826814 [Tarenaya hassleriana]XP_010558010.1 PREDICTED: uncharacterized protein LOC104826814 [Tarenaya hassleriana]XP_010558011.1 PREDICTED: uncharacterized protein LOC104826814 [Tarenaya hassleriana]XP_010558012.1 PREDICTED: uncharacterized protein LOC104826814 [Tarenaya hassleriana]XP_010558013.1 PREDICTED: uncharacterized protein LOC104826814 [Tarenaya hassleriana]
MMTRPLVLVLVFVLIVLTSQFEWKQQIESETESSLILPHEERHIPHGKESVKEKTILSQEQNIQKLKELIRSLRGQLLQCRSESQAALPELVDELDQLPFRGD